MSGVGISELDVSPDAKATLCGFVRAWTKHSYPVLFVGAGFSKFQAKRRPDVAGGSKFGSWMELLDDMATQLSNGDPAVRARLPSDGLRLAECFQTSRGRAALLDVVGKHVPAKDFVPGDAHHALRAIPWAAIVTTNYDDLLERTFQAHRRVRCVIVDDDLTQERTLNDLLLLKLHGDLEQRSTIVLTEEDYRTYENSRPGVSVKIRQLLTQHPLMFVGFSLTDPNFGRIDGWIRDTVGEMRLPALAITHGPSVAAERDMWQRRGIDLVQLREPMQGLFAALASEMEAVEGVPTRTGRPSRRVGDLAQSIRDAAASSADVTNTARRIAGWLADIVAGAPTDLDGGDDARSLVRRFSWGLHGLLDGKIATSAVYERMAPDKQQALLRLVLESGRATLQFDKTEVYVIEELKRHGLGGDELAQAYLHLAQIHRREGAAAAADEAIGLAREHCTDRALRARIASEFRELLFMQGDGRRLEMELQLPLDEPADVLARCRRGSDALLLGRVADADRWYSDALERAESGDERFVALWGKFAANVSDLGGSSEDRAILRLLRAIPAGERRASAAADEVYDLAAKRLLRGYDSDGVVDLLLRYLGEARRLGWPYSASHRHRLPIETAASDAARLLLAPTESAEPSSEGCVDRFKQGLTLLNCYGLAADVPKLFSPAVCSALGEQAEDVVWFR